MFMSSSVKHHCFQCWIQTWLSAKYSRNSTYCTKKTFVNKGMRVQNQTWRVTLANSVCLSQPCVPIAGQVTPNHLAFSQKGDENWDRDGCDQDGHQELPVVRGIFACWVYQRVCKREKLITSYFISYDCEAASWFDNKLVFLSLSLRKAPNPFLSSVPII